MEERVTELERWRIEVEAGLKAVQDVQGRGLQTKHLWIAAAGVVLSLGALLVAVAAVVVTVLISQGG